MVTASDRTDSCPECGGTGWRLVSSNGIERVRRCQCAEGQRRERLLEQAGVPARYRRCTLESFDERWFEKVPGLHADPTLARAKHAVQEFVNLFPEVEKGLLLMGNVGTGKTHLAVAALQQLIVDKGVSGRFVDFTSLILEIQMTFDGHGDQREIVRPLIEANLLVLDELGARKPTAWAQDLLYYLVNTRYVEERATIYTTNYSDFARGATAGNGANGHAAPLHDSLRDRVSARVRSRLYEMCRRVDMKGHYDYRQHMLATADERRNP